jgi:hypothetical protein
MNGKKYVHSKELGRGTQGIVHLFHEEKNVNDKVAFKVARISDRNAAGFLNREDNKHRAISTMVGLKKYIPQYFGNTFFGNAPVIRSEFIEFSIEEYL